MLARDLAAPGPVAGGGSQQITEKLAENEGKRPLRLGLIIGIGTDPFAPMAKV